MACKKLQITEDNVKSFIRSKVEISPNGIKVHIGACWRGLGPVLTRRAVDGVEPSELHEF